MGGLTVAFHGYTRYTKDLDLLYDTSEPNVTRAREALTSLGYTGTARILGQPEMVIQLGRPPFQLDFLSRISGVEYEEAYAESTEHPIEGAPELLIRVISLAHLRRNKLASGRPQDLADISRLPSGD